MQREVDAATRRENTPGRAAAIIWEETHTITHHYVAGVTGGSAAGNREGSVLNRTKPVTQFLGSYKAPLRFDAMCHPLSSRDHPLGPSEVSSRPSPAT